MTEKFILRGDDTFHLAPFKYPWAYTMFKHSLENHWVPQEIGMGADKACYESQLSADERHLFTRVFATLTTADLAIGGNAAERISPLVKAAEVKLYLTRQVAEEGLHSHSYQHIIEVLGLDQDEIYTLYQREPGIAQWFDIIREMTAEANVAELLFLWYALFEGTFFMAGFAAIMSLQRRGLMVGTGEQLQYIMRDEAMHVGFGLKLLSTIWQEEKELRMTQQQAQDLVVRVMGRLAKWADACIPNVLGYSSTLHVSHARYLVDRRMNTLGFSRPYCQETVFPWLDEQTGGLKKEKNFFESRVTEYRSAAALSWES